MSIYKCEGLNCDHRISCPDEEWELLYKKSNPDGASTADRPYIVEKTCPCFSDNNVDDIVAETEHLVAFIERDLGQGSNG